MLTYNTNSETGPVCGGRAPIERKFAAIMFTDIAGYTEQMSKSKSKTL